MTRSLYARGSRALVASLLLSGALVATAVAQTPFTATLSGPGNGSGTASVTVDPNASTVCYDVTVDLQPPATAAHIHRGEAGANGPIVVPFDAPTNGSTSGCVQGVDPAIISDILANPAGFYVNVHNADFPGGAIRGQLQAE
ncbi:MAG TPA: CHRD domain-containing protein [Chloroflexota bacterium]|nr:CHRD domain-containing protein [Chloroflexota bacterium]